MRLKQSRINQFSGGIELLRPAPSRIGPLTYFGRTTFIWPAMALKCTYIIKQTKKSLKGNVFLKVCCKPYSAEICNKSNQYIFPFIFYF